MHLASAWTDMIAEQEHFHGKSRLNPSLGNPKSCQAKELLTVSVSVVPDLHCPKSRLEIFQDSVSHPINGDRRQEATQEMQQGQITSLDEHQLFAELQLYREHTSVIIHFTSLYLDD